MGSPVVCTIVSNNYLAFARVLVDSLLDRHPGIEAWVLIVDEPADSIDYSAEKFQVLFAHELGIPAFRHFAFKYSLIELNTAVKPYFLAYLSRKSAAESVIYFDPDIKIYGDLAPLFELIRDFNLVLTPHLLEPLQDDKRPSERSILLSGVYNLGFLGLHFNQETLEFLEWWQQRLYAHCLHRVADGLFVDQRWMDLAPGFVSRVHILRDPGYNMAYWNLANRHLTAESGDWYVNEVPLRFFHFSGIAVDDVEKISKYQDRYKLRDRPDLKPLIEGYRQDLIEAGHQRLEGVAYAYGRFGNGVALPDVARSELWRQDARGDRWADPFEVTGTESYLDWLSQTVDREDGDRALPRIALLLWESRQDLQRAFPAPLGDDYEEFVRWILSGEPAASGLEPVWFNDLAATFKDRRIRLQPTGPHLQARHEAPADELQGLTRYDLQTLGADASFDAQQQPLIPKMAMLIWEDRHDIHEAFQAPLGQSRRAFARWYTTFAALEYRIPDALVRPTRRTMPIRDQLYASIWRTLAQRGHIRFIPQGSWRQLASTADPARRQT
jgi:hypothetical protein